MSQRVDEIFVQAVAEVLPVLLGLISTNGSTAIECFLVRMLTSST
jgi:hypothetical protein